MKKFKGLVVTEDAKVGKKAVTKASGLTEFSLFTPLQLYPILAIRDCPILPDYRSPSSPRVARPHLCRIIRGNSTARSRNNSPILDVLDKARVIMLSTMRVRTAPPIISPSAPIAFQARGCLPTERAGFVSLPRLPITQPEDFRGSAVRTPMVSEGRNGRFHSHRVVTRAVCAYRLPRFWWCPSLNPPTARSAHRSKSPQHWVPDKAQVCPSAIRSLCGRHLARDCASELGSAGCEQAGRGGRAGGGGRRVCANVAETNFRRGTIRLYSC
ncbi:hypothetical protein B0H14DRAFT_2586557 [Mycena olivaceomarginata]|nr:hypothetical protein B0H14DRAFT_2586557 [Mycena olivaceomarginata]